MYPLKIQEKYNQNDLENLSHRFTTLYTWNYISWDLRENVWSHPWVDIVPEKSKDNVYCVLDWIVSLCWEDWAYGNYVVIEHKWVKDPDNFKKETTLYSCYLHLSEYSIKKWDKLKEWDIFWKTWNTGLSTWEHLHFQIDRESAPYHSYWPYTWEDVREAWITFTDWVNEALGLENLKKYTINPLVYLDELEKYKDDNTDVSDKVEVIKTDDVADIIENDENLVVSIDDKIIDTVIKDDIKAIEVVDDKVDVIKPIEDTLIETINIDDDLVVSDNVEIASLITDVNDLWTFAKKDYFKDINSTDTYYNYINYLWKNDLISWYTDWTFRPNNTITRAELLKIIFKVLNLDIIDDNNDYFNDVPSNSWQKKYINSAIKLWIISKDNNLFRPNSFISRAEALKMILLASNVDLNKWVSCEYLDVIWTEWYSKYVNYSCKFNLIVIVWDKFYPNKNITRREVVWVFYNLWWKNKVV